MTDQELLTSSIATLAEAIASRSVSAVEVTQRYIARIDAHDEKIGAYLERTSDAALQRAAKIDARVAAGDKVGPLAGVPLALKDMLVTRDVVTTAGSKILEGWKPPYDGTAVKRLLEADAVLLGKLNCDEFGMGSSTENSAYKRTTNPWDMSRVPGGSSGGSSAAVAAGLCAGSLGTDTGGSIRQPSAFCGIVGLKPTYGRVSRFGVVAFASSLDQVGPMTRTVEDSARLLEVIAGVDNHDATSLDVPVPRYRDAIGQSVKGLRVGLPKEYFPDDLDPKVRAATMRAAHALRDAGAILVEMALPNTNHALATYYLIAPVEASSNLSRYDGVRFGPRAEGGAAMSLLELYCKTRGERFGAEVKRRIMIGTYALRSGYVDAYYTKAQQVRALIKRDFDNAFANVDVLLTPTTPTTAFAFGTNKKPVDMYLGDIFTLSCNLAGLPGLSVPCGLVDNLPLGAQLMARPLDEMTLLRAGSAIEKALGVFPAPMLSASVKA